MGLNRKEKNNFVGGFWGFPNCLKPYKLFLLTWKLNFQDGKIETRYTDKDTCLGSSVQRWPLHASGTVDGSGDGKGCRCPFGVRVGTIRGGEKRTEGRNPPNVPNSLSCYWKCLISLFSGTDFWNIHSEENTGKKHGFPLCQLSPLSILWLSHFVGEIKMLTQGDVTISSLLVPFFLLYIKTQSPWEAHFCTHRRTWEEPVSKFSNILFLEWLFFNGGKKVSWNKQLRPEVFLNWPYLSPFKIKSACFIAPCWVKYTWTCKNLTACLSLMAGLSRAWLNATFWKV